MMRIAQINILTNGSTGTIMLQLADAVRKKNYIAKTYTPIQFLRGKKVEVPDIPNHFSWGSRLEACVHYYMGILFGANGLFSLHGTRQLINDLKKFRPDILHLHNIHMFCINIPILFKFIKRNNIKVVWTLHDCWSFTGHCPHFTMVKCDKWQSGCHHCPQPNVYPKMYFDTSKLMYRLKKAWFCGINDMTIVVPSQWLAGIVKNSFLKSYPIKVIHNGIDLNTFKPTYSNFLEKYNIDKSKYILLGVAFGFDKRKGLDVFIELSKRLNNEKYLIILVGTNEIIDKQLPNNIISIHKTNNQQELAEIYTVADLFINPTREDTYPTVNMEAIACGTPVLTFETGGSPEIIDETCGAVVDCEDIDAMEHEITRICEEKPYSVEACLKKAKNFNKNDRFEEYVKLYEDSTYSTKSTI